MKYKIGDKARLREDLIVGQRYGTNIFVSDMKLFMGKIVTISEVFKGDYRIKEDFGTYYYTEEMLLPTTKYNIGDKVCVREDLEADNWYGGEIFVSGMGSLKGKIVTISKVQYNKYEIEEDNKIWGWSEEMFLGKVSEDFSLKEPVSQNTLPKEESSYDIITVKSTKVKLLLL